MEKLELYNKVRVVPGEAKKSIQGGRLKGMTDINPMWRIKVLTEEFGVCGIGWYYKVIDKFEKSANNETAVFVNIELYIKISGEWSMPIYGTGGSKFATAEKSGIFVSDECYKMATTDALSVACKQLGIGADVYFEADKTKYESEIMINDKQLKELRKEINRTGKTDAAILFNYSPMKLENMTTMQFTETMNKLKKLKDYTPPEIPKIIEEETPFK